MRRRDRWSRFFVFFFFVLLFNFALLTLERKHVRYRRWKRVLSSLYGSPRWIRFALFPLQMWLSGFLLFLSFLRFFFASFTFNLNAPFQRPSQPQICIWCWHKIRTSNALKRCCPACRAPYSDKPYSFVEEGADEERFVCSPFFLLQGEKRKPLKLE